MKDGLIKVRINSVDKKDILEHIAKYYDNMTLSEFVILALETKVKFNKNYCIAKK